MKDELLLFQRPEDRWLFDEADRLASNEALLHEWSSSRHAGTSTGQAIVCVVGTLIELGISQCNDAGQHQGVRQTGHGATK